MSTRKERHEMGRWKPDEHRDEKNPGQVPNMRSTSTNQNFSNTNNITNNGVFANLSFSRMVMISAVIAIVLIGIGVLIGYAAWNNAAPCDDTDDASATQLTSTTAFSPTSHSTSSLTSSATTAPTETSSTSTLPPIYTSTELDAATSCAEILKINGSAENGLYDILDEEGSFYRTYCDMETGGGGWTLVASVHENNLSNQGRCTIGDRWTSQQRTATTFYNAGDRAWESNSIFGAPEACTSDDYKNPGYYNMIAEDIMIWHVPNDTPLKRYQKEAFLMYHTENGILESNGGNLKMLFTRYPIRNGYYTMGSDNGPSAPVVWDRGDDETMIQNTPPYSREETTPGYVQFRAISHQKEAYALCPGLKINDGKGNVQYVCIGGAGSQYIRPHYSAFCGDFAAKDRSGYATGTIYSSNKAMTESVVMIFYR